MLLPSLLRTVVPLLAGWAITVLSGLGLVADSATISGGITVAVAAIYYLIFRVVERASEKLGGPAWVRAAAGLLLGYAKPPKYESTDDVASLVRASRS
ncbi:hypothetical protein [Streptomyces cylindrosporus]|uniref:Uncharacterized protein n=1 Tax=Streptomyces cylindrosporus TaxID=2927583 RepID=A0ABS9Y2F0_9ACTN|nr:hypothetical protein [Streptomyces cylindrosporus]MCI3271384.1 hypothetical protein [Streptomyces cylindrosporus]